MGVSMTSRCEKRAVRHEATALVAVVDEWLDRHRRLSP